MVRAFCLVYRDIGSVWRPPAGPASWSDETYCRLPPKKRNAVTEPGGRYREFFASSSPSGVTRRR
jgi:hypothetical protein